MKKLTMLIAAAVMVVAISAPRQAEARGNGGAVAAGIALGVIAGAMLSSQHHRPHYRPRAPYGYNPYYGQRAYQRGYYPQQYHPRCSVQYRNECIRTRTSPCAGYNIRQVRVCR